MPWTEVRRDERVVEWERSDGHATIRLRARPNDTWAVRIDRLYQALDGPFYRRETAETREQADDLVGAWKTKYDVTEETD